MQTHFTEAVVPDGEFRMNVCGPDLAVITIGAIVLYVGMDDAGRLTRALIAAADGMLAYARVDAGVPDGE